jgi:hypothetical protein
MRRPAKRRGRNATSILMLSSLGFSQGKSLSRRLADRLYAALHDLTRSGNAIDQRRFVAVG